MRIHTSHFVLGTFTVLVGLGWGCGGGGGCGGLTPLPKDPGPRGMPPDQEIEGGAQIRITKPGFDKISSLIPALAGPALTKPSCLPKQDQNFGFGDLIECDSACNGGQGCPIDITLRPDIAPPGGIAVSIEPGNTPIVHVDAAFDIHIPVPIDLKVIFLGTKNICTLNIDAPGTHINADIGLGIDGPGGQNTGELTIALNNLTLQDLNLKASGCGAGGAILSAILSFVDTIAKSFVGNLLIQLVKPQLSKAIAGLLPKPPGIVGNLSTGKMLASFDAPKDANLELLMVAGGYVSSFGGGLNLGMITGMNSDRDQTTRGPGLTSEPSLCVPARPAPDLGGAPWMLPLNPVRMNHLLDVAPEFSGMPDPMDMNGATKDLAIGLSRTFLDLAGFHIYNSGTLCLAISGSVLAQLNAGTVSVIVPSLGNILENRKSPLALVIRPEQPLVFTLGAGTMADPLLHIAATDMRIDFYAFIEERFVRIFTFALDANIGINLALTMTVDGKPAIQPMITGIDKSSVMARVSNTDLLTEEPQKLAQSLLKLIDIAVGQLMGGLKPFPLPEVSGFALDGLSVTRVQTKEDDFLAIYGDLVQQPMKMPAPVPADTVPFAREPHGVDTTAEVLDVNVPPVEVIRAALLADPPAPGSLPTVTLALGGTAGAALEWSLRVDRGSWHAWSDDPKPTLSDPAFVLQSHHQIEVRARVKGDYMSEDQTPTELDVIIDSTPPELHPTVDATAITFHGWDNVTDDNAIRYAWSTPNGWSDLGTRSSLSNDEAWRATGDGAKPLQIKAVDEAGNQNIATLDLPGMDEFHGRTTNPAPKSGCGCQLGARRADGNNALLALLALLPLGGLAFRRRLWQSPALVSRRVRSPGRGVSRSFLGLLIFCVGAALNVGCSCSHATQGGCKVDDDCRAQICDPGNIPACLGSTFGCNPDIPIGDIGRFSSMAMRGSLSYIAAYNNTYGDLMIGHVAAPGVVTNWEFVDGVPIDAGSNNPLSQVRGGITDAGDDDGRYASIEINPMGDPVIAYYDATHLSLKFASFGAVLWHTHTVDLGSGTAMLPGDDFGKYASLTLDANGLPGIAYYAEVKTGASGKRESQLRFAQAKTPFPSAATDWTITTIETRPMPDPVMGAPPPILPEGIALFCASARKGDGSPVIAYYDRERGNLRYVEFDGGTKAWGTPQILDGEDAMGNDTADVGQYPSVTVDGTVAHISYVDATHDNLLYVNTMDMTPEVVDDGYRPKDETTLDGLDAPVYHLVGDSSSIQLLQGAQMIAYQDSTVEQLRFATRDPTTMKWTLKTIAGHATPFTGSYGFYAQNRVSGGVAILSSYGIDQHHDVPVFFVETFALSLGTIM